MLQVFALSSLSPSQVDDRRDVFAPGCLLAEYKLKKLRTDCRKIREICTSEDWVKF